MDNLEELTKELGKRFGMTTKWRVYCKRENASSDDDKIRLAKQVLSEECTGTNAELACWQAELQGVKSCHIDDVLHKPTRFLASKFAIVGKSKEQKYAAEQYAVI